MSEARVRFSFLSTVALLLFNHAIQRQSTRDLFIGGLVSGYAYLIRPEAIGFMVIVPTVYVMNWFRLAPPDGHAWWRFTASMATGFLMFVAIHRLFEHRHRAVGAVSRKAGITLAIKHAGIGSPQQRRRRRVARLFLPSIRQNPLQYIKK